MTSPLRRPRPTPPPDRVAKASRHPTPGGRRARASAPTSASAFRPPWPRSACWPGRRAAGPWMPRSTPRTRVPLTVLRSVVLSRSTVFFCTRGGDFLYRFRSEKRQKLGRWHNVHNHVMTYSDPSGLDADERAVRNLEVKYYSNYGWIDIQHASDDLPERIIKQVKA